MPVKDYTDSSDIELIKHISEDQIAAFDELYSRYWKKLYTFGVKITGDKETTCDVLQESFLDIWRRRKNLNIKQVSGFMYQMVKYQLANQLRRKKINDCYLETINEIRFVNQVLEQVEFKELKLHLSESMSRLPEKCRKVFYLSRFENLSNKEIGVRMNISLSTVEKHINKALKHLRTTLIHFQ